MKIIFIYSNVMYNKRFFYIVVFTLNGTKEHCTLLYCM